MALVPETLFISSDKGFVIDNALEEINWESNNNSAARTPKFYKNVLD